MIVIFLYMADNKIYKTMKVYIFIVFSIQMPFSEWQALCFD